MPPWQILGSITRTKEAMLITASIEKDKDNSKTEKKQKMGEAPLRLIVPPGPRDFCSQRPLRISPERIFLIEIKQVCKLAFGRRSKAFDLRQRRDKRRKSYDLFSSFTVGNE